jgi:hypothetical protein
LVLVALLELLIQAVRIHKEQMEQLQHYQQLHQLVVELEVQAVLLHL